MRVAPLTTTVGGCLVHAAERWPDHEALVLPDVRLSYRELLDGALMAGRAMLGLGIVPGERVGLLMPNCREYVETLFGCALAGIPVLTINARFKARELRHVLEDADVVAVATTDLIADHVDFAALLTEATVPPLSRLRCLVLLGSSAPAGYVDRTGFVAGAGRVGAAEFEEAARIVRVREEVLMMYTSGTTANPKGCPFTHEALMRAAVAIVDRFELTGEDRFWDPLPLYHLAGLLLMLSTFSAGATFISMTHWDAGEGLRQLAGERATWAYPTFPTFTHDLLHHPDFPTTDLSAVRALLSLGTRETMRSVQEHFPDAVLVSSYGITEGGGVICYGRLDDPLEARISTGGPPLDCTQTRIVDPETDEDVAVGEVGEIVLRGAACCDGYYKDPEKTQAAWRGGWFHTGDLGTLDSDGRVAYVGRSKDMLKVGGENVAALEIEDYLATHPAVKLAQVIGVPDPRYLEVPAAFIELAPGARATEEELIAYCRGTIASFKVPRHVRFVEQWPMSSTKIQKFRLRDRLLEELAAPPS